jgi:hypothetical protein
MCPQVIGKRRRPRRFDDMTIPVQQLLMTLERILD